MLKLFKFSSQYKKDGKKNDFSHFFLTANSEEKKKLILKAARKANVEQQAVVRSYKDQLNIAQ